MTDFCAGLETDGAVVSSEFKDVEYLLEPEEGEQEHRAADDEKNNFKNIRNPGKYIPTTKLLWSYLYINYGFKMIIIFYF